MNKTIIIAVLAIALFGAGGISGYFYAKRASDRGVIKQLQSDANEVIKHDMDRKVTVEKVERIVTRIKKVYDPSLCYNRPIPDSAVKLMRDADSATRP